MSPDNPWKKTTKSRAVAHQLHDITQRWLRALSRQPRLVWTFGLLQFEPNKNYRCEACTPGASSGAKRLLQFFQRPITGSPGYHWDWRKEKKKKKQDQKATWAMVAHVESLMEKPGKNTDTYQLFSKRMRELELLRTWQLGARLNLVQHNASPTN